MKKKETAWAAVLLAMMAMTVLLAGCGKKSEEAMATESSPVRIVIETP